MRWARFSGSEADGVSSPALDTVGASTDSQRSSQTVFPRMSQTAGLSRLRSQRWTWNRRAMVMRVFGAGGTGVMGRRLVPQLVARGHQVTATTTSAVKLDLLAQLGADGVVMDGLNAVSVKQAVAAARPDAIVHQMTAISMAHAGKPDLKHPDRWFATSNRLRTEGTDHLLAAAEATGVS